MTPPTNLKDSTEDVAGWAKRPFHFVPYRLNIPHISIEYNFYVNRRLKLIYTVYFLRVTVASIFPPSNESKITSCSFVMGCLYGGGVVDHWVTIEEIYH